MTNSQQEHGTFECHAFLHGVEKMNDNREVEAFEFTIKNTDYFGHTTDMIILVQNESVEKMIEKAFSIIDRDIREEILMTVEDVQIHSEFENNDEEFENSINITYKDTRPSINDRYIYDHIYCSYDLAKRLVSRDFKEIKCLAVEFDSGPVSDSRSYNMFELAEHSEFYIQKYQ